MNKVERKTTNAVSISVKDTKKRHLRKELDRNFENELFKDVNPIKLSGTFHRVSCIIIFYYFDFI
jgi:hypothetical protein